VIQAEAGFELAVVVLDPPPDLGQAHQFFDGGGLGQGGQPVAGGFITAGWPFGQQPAGREAAVGGAGDVVVGVAESSRHDTTKTSNSTAAAPHDLTKSY